MGPTYVGFDGGASVRAARRALRALDGGARSAGVETQLTDGLRVEHVPLDANPPRVEPATVIEGEALVAHRPKGEPVAAFGAFLDGVQASRILAYWDGGVPVVHGSVAAVVRVRVDYRLTTWPSSALVSRALYLPEALAPSRLVAALRARQLEVVDTLNVESPRAPRHPLELVSLARTAVQRRRESIEVALAEAWCARADAPLFMDGGISGAGAAARHRLALGVVKSHHTLYSAAGNLAVVTGLRSGERTSAFVVSSPRRTAVASWYLRLPEPAGDPFFGLVRVEAALAGHDAARADLVSRWVLAERTPLALPDPRWSTMAYGVRDGEQYLRAITDRD